jgi:hypothetical protein
MAEGVRIFVGLSTLNQTTTSECTPEEGSEAMRYWLGDFDTLAGPQDEDGDDFGGFYDDWGPVDQPAPTDYFVLNEDNEWKYKGIGKAAWETGSPDIVSVGFSNYSFHVSINLISILSSLSTSLYLGPVVLDLDGDGVELVARNASHAWYDLLGDGSRVHAGWVGADDALLAIDLDGDDEISAGGEVAFNLLTKEDKDDTDMEALATLYDSNADGLLDQWDAHFDDFRVWQDKNGNGESDEGELETLQKAGIESVGLVPAKVDYESGGNRILGFSSYTRGGQTGWAADVAFGFEGNSYTTIVENGYMRVIQTKAKGLAYGVGTAGALNLDMAANALAVAGMSTHFPGDSQSLRRGASGARRRRMATASRRRGASRRISRDVTVRVLENDTSWENAA